MPSFEIVPTERRSPIRDPMHHKTRARESVTWGAVQAGRPARDKKAVTTRAGGWVRRLVVCVMLMFGPSGSAYADDTQTAIADDVRNKLEKTLGIIIPGASFAHCEESEFPAKCEANQEDLVKALAVLSKIRFMQWGYDAPLKKDDFIRFFETDFLEISFCFQKNCNFGINYTDANSQESFNIWSSLGQYLRCRYVVYQALKNTSLDSIPPSLGNNLEIDSRARKVCLGSEFPEHLFVYIDEIRFVRERTKF